MTRTPDLCERLVARMAKGFSRRLRHRRDEDRFGPSRGRTLRSRAKDLLWDAVFSGEARGEEQRVLAALESVAPFLPGLEALHGRLEDERSRDRLGDVLAHRVLGPERGPALPDPEAYWEQRERARKTRQGTSRLEAGFMDWSLERYDLGPLGYPISLYARASTVHHIFMREQYRYAGAGGVQVDDGDHVIDAGSGWGDASLYFAFRAGPAGRVAAFEFLPGNLRVLARNRELNPDLAARIDVVERPLWSTTGVSMAFRDRGPATVVRPGPMEDADGVASSLTLDDFVAGSGMPRVDFIKMDVEGAELEALHGARHVLAAHRPKLAISVYHDIGHFTAIPELIDSLGLGYVFFLDHFTTHAEETVLFARCR